jgi:uncharacterized DUF497 family protein
VPPTVIDGPYEWDHAKDAANREKHGVSFPEAATTLANPETKVLADPRHEGRFLAIGFSIHGQARMLTVVFEARGERERIISAWRSTRTERKRYMRPEADEG